MVRDCGSTPGAALVPCRQRPPSSRVLDNLHRDGRSNRTPDFCLVGIQPGAMHMLHTAEVDHSLARMTDTFSSGAHR